MATDRPPDEPSEERDVSDPPEVIDAATLFEGRREIWIELEGVRYRLWITRRNKLILQK